MSTNCGLVLEAGFNDRVRVGSVQWKEIRPVMVAEEGLNGVMRCLCYVDLEELCTLEGRMWL